LVFNVLSYLTTAIKASDANIEQLGTLSMSIAHIVMQSEQSTWDRVRTTFQKIWGYEDFRPPQGEIVQTLLAHQDALIVMPTGGGKSICFQLPALLRTGLTLVVSPLVALMENQVQELCQRQLPAALLHGELPAHRRRQTLQALEKQQLRLLYLSPETLLSEPVWQRLCQPELQLTGMILDEAHCLVQWSEFRPAYGRLGAVRPALMRSKPSGSTMSIAAFTATADPQAQQTICKTLQLQQPQMFLLSPYRPNLHLAIQIAWTPRGRQQRLLKFIAAHPQQVGLIYVRTRRDSETLAEWLRQQGYQTAAYHAGLGPDQRRAIESAWLGGSIPFVVCTCAFGMGINAQSEVRWVIHFQAPLLLSEYVQEIGRAGRQGNPADALMLVSEPTGWLDPGDRQRQQFFLTQAHEQQQAAKRLVQQIPTEGSVDEVTDKFKDGAITLSLLHSSGQLEWITPFQYRLLNPTSNLTFSDQTRAAEQMNSYLKTTGCRWEFLLNAFGFGKDAEVLRSKGGCGCCDRCLSRKK
jgi:ATP-dependent DNA helicase RecQ